MNMVMNIVSNLIQQKPNLLYMVVMKTFDDTSITSEKSAGHLVNLLQEKVKM